MADNYDTDIAVEHAALAEEPPEFCPGCHDKALNPVKDEFDRWTWQCKEGCNP